MNINTQISFPRNIHFFVGPQAHSHCNYDGSLGSYHTDKSALLGAALILHRIFFSLSSSSSLSCHRWSAYFLATIIPSGVLPWFLRSSAKQRQWAQHSGDVFFLKVGQELLSQTSCDSSSPRDPSRRAHGSPIALLTLLTGVCPTNFS